MKPLFEYKDYNQLLMVARRTALSWPIHQHYYIEMIYVERGAVDVVYSETEKSKKVYTIHAKEIIIIFPNIIHSYVEHNTDEEPIIFIFNFSPNVVSKYQSSFLICRPINPVLKLNLLNNDVSYILERFCDRNVILESRSIILSYFSIFFERVFNSISLAVVNNEYIHDDEATLIINYIASYFKSEITLDDISQHTGINKYDISRFFSKNIKQNIRTYINSLRINEAQDNLRNTEKSITEIMLDCGYENQQTFNRVFKQLSGITPYAYRKNYRDIKYLFTSPSNGIVYFEQVDPHHQIRYMNNFPNTLEQIIEPYKN